MRPARPLLLLALLLAGLLAFMLAAVLLVSEGVLGRRHGRGAIEASTVPQAAVAARGERTSQILFGDLHVRERAWSSPIWLQPPSPGAPRPPRP